MTKGSVIVPVSGPGKQAGSILIVQKPEIKNYQCVYLNPLELYKVVNQKYYQAQIMRKRSFISKKKKIITQA